MVSRIELLEEMRTYPNVGSNAFVVSQLGKLLLSTTKPVQNSKELISKLFTTLLYAVGDIYSYVNQGFGDMYKYLAAVGNEGSDVEIEQATVVAGAPVPAR